MPKRGPRRDIPQAERERLREEVTRLSLRGWTPSQIAELQGRSRQMVFYDLKKVTDMWRKRQLGDMSAIRNRQLDALQVLEGELWQAWDRSKGEFRSQRTRTRRVPVGVSVSSGEMEEEGDSDTTPGSTVERVEHEQTNTVEERGGDPRYIELLLRVQQERSKLVGVYPKDQPESQEGNEPVRRVVVYLPAKTESDDESKVIDVTPGGPDDDDYEDEVPERRLPEPSQ